MQTCDAIEQISSLRPKGLILRTGKGFLLFNRPPNNPDPFHYGLSHLLVVTRNLRPLSNCSFGKSYILMFYSNPPVGLERGG